MSNRADLGHVYDQLVQEGYIDDAHSDVFELTDQNASPWFIQGLMGCGGWIAALFLLGVIGSCIGTFLVSADEASIGILLLIIGAIFTLGTAITHRIQQDRVIFATQLLLTFHIAGQLLLLIGLPLLLGFSGLNAEVTIVCIYAIVLQIVFIVIYPNAIYRFLAILAICVALYGIAYINEIPLLVSVFIGSVMFIGMLIWLDRLPVSWQINYADLIHPVGYGAMIGAYSLMISEVLNRYDTYADVQADTAYITTSILFLFLIWLEIELLNEYELNLTSPIAIATFIGTAIVALPLLGISWSLANGFGFDNVSTPGILAGVIGILLAFRRRNRILLGISYLYMTGFIIYYYYWLDVTLLTKSVILMATGVLLIVVRFVLRRMVAVPETTKGLSV